LIKAGVTRNPMGRAASPEEIAEAAVFLLSGQGVVMLVDGGTLAAALRCGHRYSFRKLCD
jgi:hypothetical protein